MTIKEAREISKKTVEELTAEIIGDKPHRKTPPKLPPTPEHRWFALGYEIDGPDVNSDMFLVTGYHERISGLGEVFLVIDDPEDLEEYPVQFLPVYKHEDLVKSGWEKENQLYKEFLYAREDANYKKVNAEIVLTKLDKLKADYEDLLELGKPKDTIKDFLSFKYFSEFEDFGEALEAVGFTGV
jgi:hypothetical protein